MILFLLAPGSYAGKIRIRIQALSEMMDAMMAELGMPYSLEELANLL